MVRLRALSIRRGVGLLVLCSLVVSAAVALRGGPAPYLAEVPQIPGPAPLRMANSTNPVSPTKYPSFPAFETYSLPATSYYYDTGSHISTFSVFWVAPLSAAADCDLYLYNDSGYTALLSASCRGPGQPDWIVVRNVFNDSWHDYYPRIYVHPGSAGTVALEDEGSVSARMLQKEEIYVGQLSESNRIEGFVLFMNALGFPKTFEITADASGYDDFDLYLYNISDYSPFANATQYLAKADHRAVGRDEVLTVRLERADILILVVVGVTIGPGIDFTVQFAYASAPPIPFLLPLWLGVGGAVAVGRAVWRRRVR